MDLGAVINEAYLKAAAVHGDLGITIEYFAEHLNTIVDNQLGETPAPSDAVELIDQLRTDELYLTAACALASDSAWERLFSLYTEHVDKVAHNVCNTHQQAREVSSNVLTHLFFPDRSGRRRIASYEGYCSLNTWLATIVKNLAINRRELRSAEAVPLDSLRLILAAATNDLDAALLNCKYGSAIKGSFETAANELDERERLVLALSCDDEVSAIDIARMLSLHPAQISRAGKKARLKFRTAVMNCLSARYKLSAAAMDECVGEILSGQEIWISAFLRTSSARLQTTTN